MKNGSCWVTGSSATCAAEQACKGKRFRPNVADIHFNLEHELWTLHEELSTKTYRPGVYRSFSIYEPKPRPRRQDDHENRRWRDPA